MTAPFTTRRWRLPGRLRSTWWLAVVMAVLLLTAGRPLLERADLVLYDLIACRIAPALAHGDGANGRAASVLVAIDDTSLQVLGRWPWSRRQHAELVEALHLAGVHAIGYGVMFAEPSADPADDRQLADAIAAQGKVVLPVMPVEVGPDRQISVLRPLPILAQAAAALGHAEVPIDPDGQVRRIALHAGSGTTGWLSQPLALQQVAAGPNGGDGRGLQPIVPPESAAMVEPWWRSDIRLLGGGVQRVTQVSAADVLRDPQLARQMAGRVVWIGVTARGINMPLATPLAADGAPLSAVEWQSGVYAALSGPGLINSLVSTPAQYMGSIGPLMLMAGLVRTRVARRGSVPVILLWLAWPLAVATLALLWGTTWWPPGTIMLSVVLAAALGRAIELHNTRSVLRQERHEANTTLQALTDAVITIDSQSRIRHLNAAAERLSGHTQDQARGRSLNHLMDSPLADRQMLDQAIRTCLDQQRPISIDLALHATTPRGECLVRAMVSPIPGSEPAGLGPGAVVVLTDVTDTIRAEQQIEHGATHDGLTGLPNRVLLSDRLNQAIAHGRHQSQPLAVLFIDLDRFGRINDSLGQRQGDQVLQIVTTRMRHALRAHDTFARWGNDQFVVLLENALSREIVAAVATQLMQALDADIRLHDIDVACSCSIGISLWPEDARVADDLLSMSGAAMARAKAAGGGRFEFYATEMSARIRDWLALESRLRHALDAGEFVVHYQVQVDLSTGRPVGMEALLRWRQPDGELWVPGRFLAVTEETGLIVDVGSWVLREAMAQQRRWRDAGVPLVPVSVNVSARQCLDSRLVDVITEALQSSGMPGGLLKLEITESTAMADFAHLNHLLAQLRALDVRIALDDFGTGFSSLAHLKHIPFDQIKIDPSFVADIHRNSSGAAIVRATIALAHGLGVPVVAEGVENRAQLAFLREHQCDIVQGYLYSRPCTAGEIERLLTSTGALPHCLLPESHS